MALSHEFISMVYTKTKRILAELRELFWKWTLQPFKRFVCWFEQKFILDFLKSRSEKIYACCRVTVWLANYGNGCLYLVVALWSIMIPAAIQTVCNVRGKHMLTADVHKPNRLNERRSSICVTAERFKRKRIVT